MNYSNKNEFENLVNSRENTVVVFSADWCGPCKAMAPILEKANQQYPNRIIKLNLDDSSNLADELGVMSIPTLLTFNKGSILKRKVGMVKNVQEISSMLN